MAHSKDIEDIPKSTVRAVAKKLKYYIDVQRREEAFDLSGCEHPMGAFTSSKGGSLYYNSMQDKLSSHFLSQPQLKKHTSDLELKPPPKTTPRPYSAVMNFIKQESTISQESNKLVNTASKLLLNSNIKHLNRTGSVPSAVHATTHSHHSRPLSHSSPRPSSTSSDLPSRSYNRKKRSTRKSKQSTPVVQSLPGAPLDGTRLQSLAHRIDLASSASSNGSSLQSLVTQLPEDDDLMQYTYHGYSRKPSLSNTLFTRSDSALCVQKRIVNVNKKKTTHALGKVALPVEESADSVTGLAVSNGSSKDLVNQSIQNTLIQSESSTQTTDSKVEMRRTPPATNVGVTTSVSSSVHSVGVQVTECCDSSTQTLNEVGIQTDLSAIMDQKRAERHWLKKQSQESMGTGNSNPPSVVVTSPSDVTEHSRQSGDDVASSGSHLQDLEADRKAEELRRHIAATTIQQYYRGFKSGVRAKKSEQQIKYQEPLSAKMLPVGVSIHEAARTGNVDRIKELSIEASSLIDLLDERGYTPLLCAVENGSLEGVKMLSICGADMHKETPTGYTAMHIAALSGHVNCLKLLHALECSLKCQSVDMKTPLHLAAMCGHLECCKWLLSNRAKLNVKDVNNRTPLQLAEESEQHQIVDLLTSYENELKYAKGALKQLRARRSNSTEGTDDEGWLSDTKQPGSPSIKLPATIIEEQKQLYEQIQKDKDDSDSTFLDVARIAVEKELQASADQSDQQPKHDNQHQHTNNQANQHDDHGQKHKGQSGGQGEHYGVKKHEDQDEQNDSKKDQGEQNDQAQQNNDQEEQYNSQGHQHDNQDQEFNDQIHLHNANDDQAKPNDEHSTEEQDHSVNTKQETASHSSQVFKAAADVDVPLHTHTSPARTNTETENADVTSAVQMEQHGTAAMPTEDMPQQPKDDITNITNHHQDTTGADGKDTLPELGIKDTPEELKQDTTSSSATHLQDKTDSKSLTEAEAAESTDRVVELSVENLAAHNVANPPLIERTDTQQTLTNVTMIDKPIRLEQLSRSSLDSEYSKKQKQLQIIQRPSTARGSNSRSNKEDDVIEIIGTVDTGTLSVSSSTLSNLTD